MRTGYEENGISIHTILLFELSIFFCCIKLLYIIYMYCFIFFIRLLVRTNIKVQIFLSASIIYPTFRKVWCFYCYKNVFKTSSTSLLLCYIHVHSLIQGENKLVEFYPFSQISFCNSWSGQSQNICCNCLVI